LWTMPRKRTIYRKVKNVQISGSVLYKNKIHELVFFWQRHVYINWENKQPK
jgi:hypothetical protein